MFNDADLWDRVGNGALVDFSTYADDQGLLDPDDKIVRDLFVTAEALREVLSWEQIARDQMLAEMVQFIVGAPVRWGDPRKGSHLKPLDPATRWVEFKVRPRPQTRLFGGFVRKDYFVSTHASTRDAVNALSLETVHRSWIVLWGEDVSRLECDDPAHVLTNYVSV